MFILNFTDNARRAALHLLDSPFGGRLRELPTVAIEDLNGRCLQIRYDTDIRHQLSSGERILLTLLEAMTYSVASPFTVVDLAGIDDREWERVIAALFILRGRVLETEAVAS